VVFVQTLWSLPGSRSRWAPTVTGAEYAPLCPDRPDRPDNPDTVAEVVDDPGVSVNQTIGQVTTHYAAIIDKVDRKPVVIRHSFGGLRFAARDRHRAVPLTFEQFHYGFADAVGDDEAREM
jgi:non-heme chloroperoxidase